jgi:sec-independent protein translocase protein TatA
MNFGNMGFMEILLILVVVLLLFGAKRIPEIAQSMGKGIREFKKSVTDVDRAVREPERESRLDRGYEGEATPQLRQHKLKLVASRWSEKAKALGSLVR